MSRPGKCHILLEKDPKTGGRIFRFHCIEQIPNGHNLVDDLNLCPKMFVYYECALPKDINLNEPLNNLILRYLLIITQSQV